MANELPDPEAFINSYRPDTPVVAGKGKEMTLEQALKFEDMFCEADKDTRQDPVKRLGYLANMLASTGSLRPEDEHLLGKPE